MAEIELSIGNPFVTKVLRPERSSSLFARVYTRLSVDKLDPGKVAPLFTRIDGDHKLFGAFTFNAGGSASFFPDFYNLDNFDHLTLSADFITKKGHLTKIESDGVHTKTMNLEASAVAGNDYYHLVTFGMDSDDLLMDAPAQIQLPPIFYTTEEERTRYTKWIEDSVHVNSVLEFPEGDGSYFVQILVLPKGKSTDGLAIERSFVEKMLESSVSFEGKTLTCKKVDIPTPDKSDFSICILTFRIEGGVKGTFCFLMAQDPAKPAFLQK